MSTRGQRCDRQPHGDMDSFAGQAQAFMRHPPTTVAAVVPSGRGGGMMSRPFCYIAGIDQNTLSACPTTDKLWATHLGFSLCLSFLVVLGISFHATGYVIPDTRMRLIVCT